MTLTLYNVRYIPRERFLDPPGPPLLSIFYMILKKVSQLNITRGRSARPPSEGGSPEFLK